MSQTRIGVATGLYQGRVSYIIHDKHKVKSLKKLAEIADGLGMPGHARATLGLASGSAALARHACCSQPSRMQRHDR